MTMQENARRLYIEKCDIEPCKSSRRVSAADRLARSHMSDNTKEFLAPITAFSRQERMRFIVGFAQPRWRTADTERGCLVGNTATTRFGGPGSNLGLGTVHRD